MEILEESPNFSYWFSTSIKVLEILVINCCAKLAPGRRLIECFFCYSLNQLNALLISLMMV